MTDLFTNPQSEPARTLADLNAPPARPHRPAAR
jgi:hypothetical protein